MDMHTQTCALTQVLMQPCASVSHKHILSLPTPSLSFSLLSLNPSRGMAWQVKVLPAKADNLSLLSRAHKVEEES